MQQHGIELSEIDMIPSFSISLEELCSDIINKYFDGNPKITDADAIIKMMINFFNVPSDTAANNLFLNCKDVVFKAIGD